MEPTHLNAVVKKRALEWREAGFRHDDYPAIGEILDFQLIQEKELRWLRGAQYEALIAYWHLRLGLESKHVLDLYRSLYPEKPQFRKALGIDSPAIMEFLLEDGESEKTLFEKIRTDDEFVKTHKLTALRETLLLDYPSYIMALTMGAGKTALIAAIIATEFAMALEYPDGPFMKNALVFAPGKTILGSLRQIASVPYEKILPPRLHKTYAATVKLIFTRDGDPHISVIRGDSFNVIITNTEKIRITKDKVRKGDLPGIVASKEDEAREELANQRLQAIASLPSLGVFSDEAHHTYGNKVDATLKRVRETINYLHEKTDLVAVINTTGTPYVKKHPLLDVVFWYGLSQGIKDGILKQVAGNIHAYEFDDQATDDFIGAVIDDFFGKYKDVTLPDGSLAKLAIYFPQTDDLSELRPIIETKMQLLGLSSDIVLANTTKSSTTEIDAFNRLNEPSSPHRVILLVNKGTEGWDCPSLFATALARKLKGANNFVLQAACRCLRQVPGNNHPASIYLSDDNRKTLDKELAETYGESLRDLNLSRSDSKSATITLRKLDIAPLLVKQLITRVVPGERPTTPLTLSAPKATAEGRLTRRSFDFSPATEHKGILTSVNDPVKVHTPPETIDTYSAAVKLAAVYRLPVFTLKEQLESIYPDAEVPEAHLPGLASQVEAHTSCYTTVTEEVEVALALVKPEGFHAITDAQGTTCYTAEISYPATKEHLLKKWEDFQHSNGKDFAFHYSPYHFDSNPEAAYFEELLTRLNLTPGEIDDFYFTGALTSSNKTDFLVEYKDVSGKWRTYTPDFVVRRKDGKCLIVEIKKEDAAIIADLERLEKGEPTHTTEGRKAAAVKRWQDLNPDRIKYQVVAVDDILPLDATDEATEFLKS